MPRHSLSLTWFALLGFFLFSSTAVAQENASSSIWKTTQFKSISFRGAHISEDGKEVWVSGTEGTVLVSTDQAQTWTDVSPPGAQEHDFRDIHGLGNGRAVAMAIASPGKIYGTNDFGKSWQVVYQNDDPGVFLDAVAFMDKKFGIAFGDPLEGHVFVLRTIDGGQTWGPLQPEHRPAALDGEGGFAASGTCLCITGRRILIGLGGERSSDRDPKNARLIVSDDLGISWQVVDTPMLSGKASGIFSIAFSDSKHGVMTGGTYDQPEDASNNVAITSDGGDSWTRPNSTPRGYRSCVFFQPGDDQERPDRFIAIGKTGSDVSTDQGQSWQSLDDTGFYAAACSPDGSLVVAVGADGRIGVLRNDLKR